MSLTSIAKTQHIRNDEMQFTEQIESKSIFPEYIPTAHNTADLLTKGLNGEETAKHAATLLGLGPESELIQYSRSFALT